MWRCPGIQAPKSLCKSLALRKLAHPEEQLPKPRPRVTSLDVFLISQVRVSTSGLPTANLGDTLSKKLDVALESKIATGYTFINTPPSKLTIVTSTL